MQNLRHANDGSKLFFADVTVYAQATGSAGNLVRGTELSLYQCAIPYFVRAAAMETFSGGENDESKPADHVMLQNAVADHVNRVPFGGLLAVSSLVTLLHENMPSGSYVTKPVLFATTYLPDGRVLTSQTSDRLVIDFPPYASNRTTMFYCDPTDVSFEQRHVERGVICG